MQKFIIQRIPDTWLNYKFKFIVQTTKSYTFEA